MSGRLDGLKATSRLAGILLASSVWLAPTAVWATEPDPPPIEPDSPPIENVVPAVGSADEAPLPVTPPTVAKPPPSAAALLTEGTAALAAGDRDRARTVYRQLLQRYRFASETTRLGWLLGITDFRDWRGTGRTEQGRPDERRKLSPGAAAIHRDPHSIPDWETADYVVTSLGYGLGIGIAYDVAWLPDDSFDAAMPVAVVAMTATTALAGIYLGLGKPDRGDLALTLTIVADLPLTAMLIGIARDDSGDHRTSAATAVAGTAAIPIAAIVAHNVTVDPGAMTLAREFGFWGMVLGAAGTTGFGRSRSCDDYYGHCSNDSPSGRVIAIAALLGLYGGLGLGGVVGTNFPVSVERARVTTLGGYAGALLGGIAGIRAYDDERGLAVLAVGAALGLSLTYVATSGMDVSTTAAANNDTEASSVVPTLMPTIERSGKPGVAWGVALSGF
jgi:hypothetical protein